MMRNGMAVTIIIGLIAAGGPAAGAPTLKDALKTCAGISDDATRLRCYDGIVPGKPAQTVEERFGSEQVSTTDDDTKATQQITAAVADLAYDFTGRFTVRLKNGQVWKQQSSSGTGAHIAGAETVTISRGMFGSYDMTFDDNSRVFKVRRTK